MPKTAAFNINAVRSASGRRTLWTVVRVADCQTMTEPFLERGEAEEFLGSPELVALDAAHPALEAAK